MKKLLFPMYFLFASAACYAQAPVFQWAKGFGGFKDDLGWAISVDASGNVYSTGLFTDSSDFDPGPGVFKLGFCGGSDIFVSKLDRSGNFVWARQIGGIGDDGGRAITVDISGNIYVTGYFSATADFDPGPGVYNLTALGNSAFGIRNAFVLKLDSDGNFIWVKNFASVNHCEGLSVAVDKYGNVFTTGYFTDTADLDPGIGVYNLATTNTMHIFISKLDTSGNFVWAKATRGSSVSDGEAIALDAVGNVLVTGTFAGMQDFDPGIDTFNLTPNGLHDAFILKLDANGDFAWAKNIGGNNYDGASGIVTDKDNNVFVNGSFSDTVDFDPGPGIFSLISSGPLGNDKFILKLDAGGKFLWVKQIPHAGGHPIAIDSASNIYVTGLFLGTTDFDPGAGVYNLTSSSSGDMFVLKLTASGNFQWVKQIAHASPWAIAIDENLGVLTIGSFEGTIDFDPGSGVYSLTSAYLPSVGTTTDIFMNKFGFGVNEIEQAHSTSCTFSIHPNPTSGIFTISISQPTKDATIEVYNTLGSLVYKQSNLKEVNNIDLTNSASGLYFVRLIENNQTIATQKIVKQ